MESYTYSSSYPDSGDSSPRSREIEFEGGQIPNSSLWDDPSLAGTTGAPHKAKFMCSYGGKIQPRQHDNQLSYIGGDTKILAVDRSIRFSSFVAKLAAVCGVTENDASSLSFKYQLPGEDLDALISVTNDDDLEHLMHEYDRVYRSSPKPTRMRLFLFPSTATTHSSCGSDGTGGGDGGGKSDRDRFVEALNSGPAMPDVVPPPVKSSQPPTHNVDFLFGLEKGLQVPVQQVVAHPPPPQPPQVVRASDLTPDFHEDRPTGSDLSALQAQFQMLQVREQFEQQQQQQQQVRVPGYPSGRTMDENFVGGGEYYLQMPPPPDRHQPTTMPVSLPPPSAGYWSEKKTAPGGGGFPPSVAMPPEQQPVYVIPGPGGGLYHAPAVMRPVTGQPGQGCYVQRVRGMPVSGGAHEFYRDQPVYGMVQPPPQPMPNHQQQLPVGVGPKPSIPDAAAAAATTTVGGYAQMAYDPALTRQVYYTAPGGGVTVTPQVSGPNPPQPVGTASGHPGTYTLHEGKVPVVMSKPP